MNSNRESWRGLIAIEGIDGAGTTTLSRNLGTALSDRGIPFSLGCEPTDGSIGKIIRNALSGSTPVLPETLALLFAADRREHLYSDEGIRKDLDSGRIYITDRYLFSSLAYQTLDADWDWVDGLNRDYPLPGHLIYLGLPVEDALKRISDRETKDIFEEADLQKRVSDSYQRSIDVYRDSDMKVLVLDSRRKPEEVCADALNFLMELF